MSSINVIPKDEVYTTTSVYIQNIFIDIQNDMITIEVNKLNAEGKVIDRETLIATGTDYTDIYDEDLLNEFVLRKLNLLKENVLKN